MRHLIYNFTFRSLTLIGVILLFNACGSKTNAPDKAQVQAASVVIDTKAYNDSKGVGKFTEVKLEVIDPAKADLGKVVFSTKCTTCHKLSAEKFVGPGLEGVTQRRTPEWIMNMITNPELMMKSDPVAKKLYEEMLTPMANQNIGDEDARNILEYLRQNDNK
ncbi:MAG: c-type cytochrome [Bacteroidales bacterium]|nr:c-type cytochrome [Bacteroidales bacterium]